MAWKVEGWSISESKPESTIPKKLGDLPFRYAGGGECSVFILPNIALMLRMMGIENIEHHAMKDLVPNTMYCYTKVFDSEKLGKLELKKIKIDIGDTGVHDVCFDWRYPLPLLFERGIYDIAVVSGDRVVLLYYHKPKVIIASDILHATACTPLAVKAVKALYDKVREVFG